MSSSNTQTGDILERIRKSYLAMSSSNTQTGDILERMILPALRRGRYTWERRAYIGERPSGASHYVDALVTAR